MSKRNIQWNQESSITNVIKDMQNELNNLISDKQDNTFFRNSIQQLESWDNFIDSFFKKFKLGKHYSRKTIELKFSQIFNHPELEDIVANSPAIAKELIALGNELASTLDQEKTFIFKTRLIQTDQLYEFDNITICNGKEKNENGESIREQCLIFLKNLRKNSSDESDKAVDEFINFINETTEETIIIIKETGDDILSKLKALDAARTFLNEIAFFADISHFYKTLPSLEIDKPNKSNFIKINEHTQRISYGTVENEIVRPILFTLNENFKTENPNIHKFAVMLKEYDFPIYQKAESNPLLSKVSIAINWYAKAQRSLDEHTKFLFCCIGLEALFSQKGAPVAETLSDNCALLLGRNLESRINIKKDVKRLYDSRSGIAHGRKPEILEHDLKLVSHILASSIVEMIKLSKYKSIALDNEVSLYFERQKMDSSSFETV